MCVLEDKSGSLGPGSGQGEQQLSRNHKAPQKGTVCGLFRLHSGTRGRFSGQAIEVPVAKTQSSAHPCVGPVFSAPLCHHPPPSPSQTQSLV